MAHLSQGVIVCGEKPPAMSIEWQRLRSRYDSGYSVIFSEFDPELGAADPTPSQVVCLSCLLEQGDKQLGRGLDLARRHRGQVDWDPDAEEWVAVCGSGEG